MQDNSVAAGSGACLWVTFAGLGCAYVKPSHAFGSGHGAVAGSPYAPVAPMARGLEW